MARVQSYPMLLLALDTTTAAGSVALWRDGLIEERAGDPGRSHAERLPGDLMAILGAHGLAPRDVERYAVAAGPGSFTGLRIGIATIQGLALVGDRLVHAVGTLELLAHDAARASDADAGTTIVAWMEAYRGEVFAARYRVVQAAPHVAADGAGDRVRGAAILDVLDPPTVSAPEPLARAWAAGGAGRVIVTGDGVARTQPILARVLRRGRGAARAGAAGRHAGGPRRGASGRGDPPARGRAHLRAPSRRRARPRSRRRASDGVRRTVRRCPSRRSISPAPSWPATWTGSWPSTRRPSIGHGRARCTNGSGPTPTWRASTSPGAPARRRRRLLRRLDHLRRAARQQPRRRSAVAAARRRQRAADASCWRRPPRRAPPARPWKSGGRTSRPGASTSGSASPSPASAPPTTASRSRMRSSSGGTGRVPVVKPEIRRSLRPVELSRVVVLKRRESGGTVVTSRSRVGIRSRFHGPTAPHGASDRGGRAWPSR